MTFDAQDLLEDPDTAGAGLEMDEGLGLDTGLELETGLELDKGLELDVDEELDDVPKLIWPRTE